MWRSVLPGSDIREPGGQCVAASRQLRNCRLRHRFPIHLAGQIPVFRCLQTGFGSILAADTGLPVGPDNGARRPCLDLLRDSQIALRRLPDGFEGEFEALDRGIAFDVRRPFVGEDFAKPRQNRFSVVQPPGQPLRKMPFRRTVSANSASTPDRSTTWTIRGTVLSSSVSCRSRRKPAGSGAAESIATSMSP